MYILDPKLNAENSKITVDFFDEMVSGTTISSAAVTAAVYSGVDATPSSIISGTAAISGTKVTQLIIGGVEGTTYTLTFSATTSDSQNRRKQAFLTIQPAFPV